MRPIARRNYMSKLFVFYLHLLITLQTACTQIRPDKIACGIPDRFALKMLFLTNHQMTKKHAKLHRMLKVKNQMSMIRTVFQYACKYML